MDFIFKNEIADTLKRTRELIESRILWDRRDNLFRRSALIEVLILLNDLLTQSDKHFNKRIAFTDDVKITKKVKDVTDLIRYFRNACCHEYSKNRKINGNVLSYNEFMQESKEDNGIVINVGFNMGEYILSLKEHIERAFFEVESILIPYVSR
jgi:hypothetical protein